MGGEAYPSRTAVIIQARMSSTRLPGQVLMPVMGKPLLGHMVERVRPAARVDELVVATSTEASDDPIARWCGDNGVKAVRGSLSDVLARYYFGALSLHPVPQTIVRLTADCPLHHHAVVDFAVKEFQRRKVDYFSNSFPPDFEDGFDVKVFSFPALEAAYLNALEADEREHVTPYIRKSPQFTREFAKYRDSYRCKLSVDSANDFNLVRAIIEALYPKDPLFTVDDVMGFLQEKYALLDLNGKVNGAENSEIRHP